MTIDWNKLFVSSQDPQKISMMVKSALLVALPIVGVILKGVGHEVDQEYLKNGIEILGNITIAFFSLVSAVGMFWGFIRKFFPKS